MQKLTLTSLPFEALCHIASFLGAVSFHPSRTNRVSSHRPYTSTGRTIQSSFNSDLLAYARAAPLLATAVAHQLSFNPLQHDNQEPSPTHQARHGLYLYPGLMLTPGTKVSHHLKLWKFWLSVLAERVTHVSLQEPQTGSQVKLEDPASYPSVFYDWKWGKINMWYHDDNDEQPKTTVTPYEALAFAKQIFIKELPLLRDLDLVMWTPSANKTKNAHKNALDAHVRRRAYPCCIHRPCKLNGSFVSAATMLLASVGPQLHRLRLPADDQLAASLRNFRKNQRPVLFPRLHILSVVRNHNCDGSCVSLTTFVCTVARSIAPGDDRDGANDDSWCSPLKTLILSNVTQHALCKLAVTDRVRHIRRSVTSLSLSVSQSTETNWANPHHSKNIIGNIARFVGAFRVLCTFQWTGLPSSELMERVLAQASPSLFDISIHSAFKKPRPTRDSSPTLDWFTTSDENPVVFSESAAHYTELASMVIQAGKKLSSLTAVSTACELIQNQIGISFLDFSPAMTGACQRLRALDIETTHSTVAGLARLIQCNDELRSLVVRVKYLAEWPTHRLLTAEGWDALGHSIVTRQCLQTVDIASYTWGLEGRRLSKSISRKESSAIVSFLLTTLQNVDSPLRVFSFCTSALLTRSFEELLRMMTDVVSILTKPRSSKLCLRELVLRFDAGFNDNLSPLLSGTSSLLQEIQGGVRTLERRVWETFRNLKRLELGQLRQLVEHNLQRVLDEEYGEQMWSKIYDDD